MRTLALALAATCILTPCLAFPQTPPPMPPGMARISGTVEQWDGQTLTIKSADGDSKVLVPADARISTRRKGTLADIKSGSFVGSAAVAGADGHLHANEVHIFPDSMRGTGEGHRDMPAPNTTMTNGNVASMTNGNVAAAGSNAKGMTLTVTYAGGQQQIDVASDVPVSIITPVERSQLKPGIQVNTMGGKAADGTVTAQMVEVVTRP
jgi:hypothetical protein